MAPQGEESVEKKELSLETQDDTLKYHLLGPSLTKAGQDEVDQRKVSSEQALVLKANGTNGIKGI